MSLSFYGKRPGPGMKLDKLSMQFSTHDTSRAGDVLEAYERLILDAMRGDHTLFTTAEGIESLWERSIPLLDDPPPVKPYTARLLGSERDPPAHRAARVAAAVRAGLAPPQRVTTAEVAARRFRGPRTPHSPGVMPATCPRGTVQRGAVPDRTRHAHRGAPRRWRGIRMRGDEHASYDDSPGAAAAGKGRAPGGDASGHGAGP